MYSWCTESEEFKLVFYPIAKDFVYIKILLKQVVILVVNPRYDLYTKDENKGECGCRTSPDKGDALLER